MLALMGGRSSSAQDKQDKYTLQVPGGLAFSEIKSGLLVDETNPLHLVWVWFWARRYF